MYVCVFVCPGRALQMCAVVTCVCVRVVCVCVCDCGCVHCVCAFTCCSMLGLGRVFVCVCVFVWSAWQKQPSPAASYRRWVMKPPVRAFRLSDVERTFLHGVLNQAIATAQKQDISLCVKYAISGITNDAKTRERAKAVLRPVVMESLGMRGAAIFRRLIKRHSLFKMVPKPLRGHELRVEAKNSS